MRPSQPAAALRRRVVVTLCADEVQYLPVTTEITSLPQPTPDGLPLALERRAAEAVRMDRAAADLEKRGEVVTSRALAQATHISREHRMHLAPGGQNRCYGDCIDVISSAMSSF